MIRHVIDESSVINPFTGRPWPNLLSNQEVHPLCICGAPWLDDQCNRARRLRVYLEPRDLWIGVYVAPHAVYVCPLPTLVIRWSRRP